MGIETMVVPVEWKAAGDDSGELVGYASTFGNVDLGQDVVVKGAFKSSTADIKANGIPLLADHVASTTHVLGTIYEAREDEKGLLIKARFSSAPSAQDVRTKLLEGHLNRMSIGYEPTAYKFEERDGKTVRLLEEIKLWETSVVVFPMNPEATISRVKSLAGALAPEDRKALADALTGDEDTQTSPPAGETAEARHAKATPDDTDTPAGDVPSQGWDRYASDAVLAGRDPNETAGTATQVGLRTRLELMESALAGKGLTIAKEQ